MSSTALLERQTGTLHAAAVYLLEEIWELVQNSPAEVSNGFVDSAIRRLNHRSPVVKQKVSGWLVRSRAACGVRHRCVLAFCRLSGCEGLLTLATGCLAQTLRLIKYICAKGSSEFKRALTKQAGPVRCACPGEARCPGIQL